MFASRACCSFFSILAFLSLAQLATVLVGAIDLSIGPLAGLVRRARLFLVPDGVETGPFAGGIVMILAVTVIFGFLQGVLITSLRLPAIVVTIATFIGLQGISLLLRPIAAGTIDDAISDAAQFPIWFLPAGLVLTLAMVGAAEWTLYRTGFGRSFRAVGSSPLASHRLGIDSRRMTWLAFVISGFLTGVGGLMLAGQVGIGSPSTGYRLHADDHHRRRARRRERRRRPRFILQYYARGGVGAGHIERVVLHRRQFLGALHRDRNADRAGGNFLQSGSSARGNRRRGEI